MMKISVIIPIYNVAPFLEKCVSSVRQQTYHDLEIILVNDGSTDSSKLLCETLATKDPRITVINKTNGGLSSARNAGLDVSAGDYIGFVDGDDYIEEDMYEKLLAAITASGAKIAMAGRFNVKGETKTPFFTFDSPQVWDEVNALGRLLIWDGLDSSVCDKLFDKSLFINTRFPLNKYNEDIYVTPYLLSEAKVIAHIGAAKYNYVVRAGSITSEHFSPKKLHLVEANALLQTYIKTHYPSLNARANSFYNQGLIYLVGLIVSGKDKKKFKTEYISLRKKLRKAYFSILKSKYISRHNKLKTTYLVL